MTIAETGFQGDHGTGTSHKGRLPRAWMTSPVREDGPPLPVPDALMWSPESRPGHGTSASVSRCEIRGLWLSI